MPEFGGNGYLRYPCKSVSKMPSDIEPDALEIRIRYAGGALLGLVIGGYFCVCLWPLERIACFAIVCVAIVVFAFLARHYGDNFWIGFLESIRWW